MSEQLYRRFNIEVDLEESIEIFKNKIENILSHGQLGEEIFNTKEGKSNIYWELCNVLGIKYEYKGTNSGKVLHIFSGLDFSEYLYCLQVLLDVLRDGHKELFADSLASIINQAIDTSPIDLGIRTRLYKRKLTQIYFSGSRFLDKKLVDDVLGVLDDKEKFAVKVAFEKGLKELLEGKNNSIKLKNAVRDAQLACDETIKVLFENDKLGFRHLFKNDRWEEVGLNKFQKGIFWNLNEYIDKFAKHKSDARITFEDAENIIYLTGMFIRLVFIKNKYEKS